MAVREIKAEIMLGGEKEFESQLKALHQELRVNDSELKALQSAYDLTDDKMDNMSRQSQVLKEKLASQKNEVAALTQALENTKGKTGATANEINSMAIRLNKASTAMHQTEKAAKEAEQKLKEFGESKDGIEDVGKEFENLDRKMEEVGRDASKVGKQIKDGIGGSMQGTSTDIQSMYDNLSSKVGGIAKASGLSLAMDIGGKVVSTIQGVMDFGESYRDYNRTMSYLDNAAYNNNYDEDFVRKLYIQAASMTAEQDAAVEGLSNLLRIGFSEGDLEKAVSGLLGASILVPDSFKFESLGQSMRETYQEGSATGNFAEMLTYMGVDLEEFNKAMKNAETEIGKQQVMLAYLTGEMTDAGQSYIDRNQDLIDAEQSSMELEDAKAEVARIVDKQTSKIRDAETVLWQEAGAVLSGEETVMQAVANIGKGVSDATGVTLEDIVGSAVNYGKYLTLNPALFLPDVEKALTEAMNPLQGREYYQMSDEEMRMLEAAGWSTGTPSKTTGKQSATDYASGLQEGMEDESDTLEAAGLASATDMTAGLASGVASGSSDVVSQVELLVEQINDELSKVNDIEIGVKTNTGGSTGGSSGTTTSNVYLDGRKVGTMVAPYVNRSLGVSGGVSKVSIIER